MNTFHLFSLRRNPSLERLSGHVFFNCHNKCDQANFNQRRLVSSFHTTFVNASEQGGLNSASASLMSANMCNQL